MTDEFDLAGDAVEALRRHLLAQAEAQDCKAAAEYFRTMADHFRDAARMAAEDELPARSAFAYAMQ